MPLKHCVILLHGVGVLGGMGAWQEPVAKILGPHFQVIQIKYPHYRWLGFISLVLDIRTLLFAGPVAAIYCLITRQHLWILLIGVILASVVTARLRYRAALRHIIEISRDAVSLDRPRPHVIAHSLGTHFVGVALLRFPDIALGHVVLAGSVLPHDFPWGQLLARSPLAVDSVRNDVGRRDFVPLFARAANTLRLVSGFGSSGWSGFVERPGLVHTVASPDARCDRCDRGEPAPIHNVLCDFNHEGVFTAGPTHTHSHHGPRPYAYAAYTWLPFLWDIEPSEYLPYIQFCLTAASADEEQHWSLSRGFEAELLRSRWSWTHGATLAEYVEQLLASHPQRPLKRGLAAEVVHLMWSDVRLAFDARDDRGVLPTIDPLRSLYRAMSVVAEKPDTTFGVLPET
jgi:hypothetical protein